jgi:hypothetical protein
MARLDRMRTDLSFRPLTPLPTIVMARLDRATTLNIVLMQVARSKPALAKAVAKP